MSDSVKSLFGYVPHNFTDGIEEPTLFKKKNWLIKGRLHVTFLAHFSHRLKMG